ncbi:MAG TPA: hypothetical protein VGE07_16490 [Herpetosiphonaceae bacterium]
MVESLTCFSLERHAGPYASWPLRSRLERDGQPLPVTLAGYLIERQFLVPAGYLIVTSCDCPFEERTTFHLLDGAYRIRSELSCFTPYATWLLEAMEPLGDRAFQVVFFNDDRYLLRVRPRPRWLGGWFLRLSQGGWRAEM